MAEQPVDYCGVTIDERTTVLALAGSERVPPKLPPLPAWNNLLCINLEGTAVEDISALRDARRVYRLILSETAVSDLTPLAGLFALEDVFLDGCHRLSDLRPLAGLSRLRQLCFARTAVRDASIVDELPMLRWVRFAIEPPGPFGWIRGAERIDISHQPVRDLSPLADARYMKALLAAHSAVEDLSPLRRLERLEALDISHTRVRSLDPLADVWNLRRLYLAHSDVEALGAARALALDRLDATGTRVDDLEPVSAWRWLRVLRIAGTRIGPVPDLRALHDLRRLDVGHLDVRDLSIVEGIKLRQLEIAHTAIRDLTPVRPALLERLDLRWSHVAELAQLQVHASTLKHLAVDLDQAPGLALLQAMQLTHLTVEGRGPTSVFALRWLAGLGQLEELQLVDCTLDDAPAKLSRNLRRLVVPRAVANDVVERLRRRRPQLDVAWQ